MGTWYAYKNISRTGIKPYSGSCPPYYDLRGEPWFDDLTARIPELKEKTIELLSDKEVELPQFLGALVAEGRWESKAFLAWDVKRALANKKGKRIFDCVKDIPGVVSLFISVLKPGTRVKAHHGDTDATYRLHIPVIIPGGLPECGIKVDNISRGWRDGEVLAFCDAHLHEVWNETDKTRVILIVDVVRKECLGQRRAICTRVLSWIFVQKVMEQKIFTILPVLVRLPIGLAILIGSRPLFHFLQRKSTN